MLNCVYHFSGDMQVVDDDDKEKMIKTGAWFDHPLKAKAYQDELKAAINEPKPKKRKVKMENDI